MIYAMVGGYVSVGLIVIYVLDRWGDSIIPSWKNPSDTAAKAVLFWLWPVFVVVFFLAAPGAFWRWLDDE